MTSSMNFSGSDFVEFKKNVDDVFLTTNATIVCLMQAGFALLEAGSIRSKNVTNIMMKNVMDIFISCVSYWLIGYALAYGSGNSFLGWTFWAGIGLSDEKAAHWLFQFVFAATAATIVSGAVAERCNFVAYIIYSAVISGFTYPIVSHWAWTESGWLNSLGYVDFAGSGVVHVVGGSCSLVGAYILGPRTGRFSGKEMPGHSTALTGVGGMILFVGFLAFNGGSLGNITSYKAGVTIASVMSNTIMGGAGAAIIVMVLSKFGLIGPSAWGFSVTLNAAITGMVSTCASADKYYLWSVFVTGIIGGIVYMLLHHLILRCKIDDPLDAIAVHLGGGLWGLVAGPLFKQNGIIYAASSKTATELGVNVLGAIAIFIWSCSNCFIMFGLLKYFGYFRISTEAEKHGLDVSKHKEPAYPKAGWRRDSSIINSSSSPSNPKSGNKEGISEVYHNHGFNIDEVEKGISQ